MVELPTMSARGWSLFWFAFAAATLVWQATGMTDSDTAFWAGLILATIWRIEVRRPAPDSQTPKDNE